MNVYPGMRVEDAGGLVGFVREVEVDHRTGAVYVVVRDQSGQLIRLDGATWTVTDDVLRLDAGQAAGAAPGGSPPVAAAAADAMATRVILPSQAELRDEAASLGAGGELKIPVIEEQAVVGTRQVEGGGVRVHKTVRERQELVEQPITREEVEVERVAVNRYVDDHPGVREEGDVTIIPVVEEVLVVEKRLLLKEEIRLVRRRVRETQRAEVTLRQEQVEIEELDPPAQREIGQ